jgi:hypothetical protein
MLYGVFVVILLVVALMWARKKCAQRGRIRQQMYPLQVEELPVDDDKKRAEEEEQQDFDVEI